MKLQLLLQPGWPSLIAALCLQLQTNYPHSDGSGLSNVEFSRNIKILVLHIRIHVKIDSLIMSVYHEIDSLLRLLP